MVYRTQICICHTHLASSASWLKLLAQFRDLATASEVTSLLNGNTCVPSPLGDKPALAKHS